jgi:hypothetical protein
LLLNGIEAGTGTTVREVNSGGYVIGCLPTTRGADKALGVDSIAYTVQFYVFLILNPVGFIDDFGAIPRIAVHRGNTGAESHRRKAEGAGGKDFGEGGHGHNLLFQR